jgi:hypothetical protein
MTDGTIRAIVFQEEHLWIAQCLEHDIVVQAADEQALERRLIGTLSAEVDHALREGKEPFANIDPAPDHFWHEWEKLADQSAEFSRSICRDHSKIYVETKRAA